MSKRDYLRDQWTDLKNWLQLKCQVFWFILANSSYHSLMSYSSYLALDRPAISYSTCQWCLLSLEKTSPPSPTGPSLYQYGRFWSCGHLYKELSGRSLTPSFLKAQYRSPLLEAPSWEVQAAEEQNRSSGSSLATFWKRQLQYTANWLALSFSANNPLSILLKSISDRYRPERIPVGPITVRHRFKKNVRKAWAVIAKTYLYNFDPHPL